ncbi:methyltransferase type 11 [Gordonia phthalatica]|uniref:Methyltransferase type 11 n=2 Tax=Gordonia phthalatica TaxID=1136941 RepID=A0A0N9NHM7_9ACTN|nr:methyltransferase type 11 [Gordonia phthalatica]
MIVRRFGDLELNDRANEYQLSGRLRWRRSGDTVELVHSYSPADISDSVVVSELSALVEQGVIAGRDDFEAAAVSLITSVGPDPRASWRAFYANSVAELRFGSVPFSPIHRRARSLIDGDSVLEVGCCFGFFALQCAGAGLRVTATDICAGALELLDDASTELRLPVATRVGDVRALPFADDSFDTVTLLHLLEHLEPCDVHTAIAESCRVARRRVVIAVPYEEKASPHFGHLRTVCEDDLRDWASAVAGPSRIFADHGGWLVIDPE